MHGAFPLHPPPPFHNKLTQSLTIKQQQNKESLIHGYSYLDLYEFLYAGREVPAYFSYPTMLGLFVQKIKEVC